MRLIVIALLGLSIVVGCASGPAASPSPTSTESPNSSASPAPDEAFYMRAWLTQALPPRETFTWLPMVTISDGLLIDGNVAVPAIYPGPLMITPFARSISDAGIQALIDEARALGLLDGETDFTGGSTMPGSRTGHITIVLEGTTYDLIGSPEVPVECDEAGRCEAEPGTPAAFAAFWRELETSSTLLEPELGPVEPYVPERIALLLTAPPPNEPGLSPAPVPWPLETPIAESGVEYPGLSGERCLTLVGESLDAMLPILESGSQLTVFVDDQDTQAGALVRVLVPGEESTCADGV